MEQTARLNIFPAIKITSFVLFFICLLGVKQGSAFTLTFEPDLYAVNEGDGNGDIFSIPVIVKLKQETPEDAFRFCEISGKVSVAGGTATVDQDYTIDAVASNFTLVLGRDSIGGPGEAEISVPITITQDQIAEGLETIELEISPPDPNQETNDICRLGTPAYGATARVDITDDDQPPGTLQFSAATFTGPEGAVATITVIRKEGSAGELSADIEVGGANDSATPEQDYGTPSVTRLSWADGDVEPKSFTIALVDDDILEGSEVFSVRLTRFGEVLLDTTSVTITDDNLVDETTVERVEIISGDRQRFSPENNFEDLVVQVFFSAGEALEEVPIDWTITPENSGTLRVERSFTDAQGASRNSFIANTTRRVVVRATVRLTDVVAETATDFRRLQPRAEGDDPFVEFVINPGLAETQGLTPNQASVATALDTTCPSLEEKEGLTFGEQDLLETCRELQDPNATTVAQSLGRLAHEEVSTQGTVLVETGNLQVMNVNARLNAIRAGSAGGFDVSGLTVKFAGQALPQVLVQTLLGGGSAGEGYAEVFSRWSGFINGEVSLGDKSGTRDETGFEFQAVGLTAGLDYRVSRTTVVGLSLGYGANDSDLDASAGSMDMTGLYVTGYGTYFQTDRIYINGLVKIGFSDYDTERRVSSLSDPLQLALADTEGSDFSFSLSGGYDYNRGAMTLTPYGRMSYITASIDGYTETASNPGGKGAGSVLVIGSQDVDSATAVLGGQLSYAISKPGAVYLPQLRFEWEHEFKDDSRSISAQFVHDPSNQEFSIASDSPDRDYFNLGLGFSAVAPHGRSGFLYYETRIAQDNVEQHWLKAGFRIEF